MHRRHSLAGLAPALAQADRRDAEAPSPLNGFPRCLRVSAVHEVRKRRRFPKLEIVQGNIGKDGQPSTPALRDAFRTAAVFIHGPAAGILAGAQMAAWRKLTAEAPSPLNWFPLCLRVSAVHEVRKRREIQARGHRRVGVHRPTLGFASPGSLTPRLLDSRPGAFLRENRLEPGRFICVIPRLRFTPYQKFRPVTWTAEETRRRMAVNDQWAEIDHAKLREVVVAWVRHITNHRRDAEAPSPLNGFPLCLRVSAVYKRAAARVLQMHADTPASRRKVADAVAYACRLQAEAAAAIRKSL